MFNPKQKNKPLLEIYKVLSTGLVKSLKSLQKILP